MDTNAFDRAREQFRRKTKDLSEEQVQHEVEVLVEETRAESPTATLLGVTYSPSSEVGLSEASSTLSFSSEA